MIKENLKKQEREWCATNRLSQEQFKELLKAKFIRAQQMHSAIKQREANIKKINR